jgi:hypothetical protein
MNEAQWHTCADPGALLASLGDLGYPKRRGHLFGVACCRRLWDRIALDDAKQIVVAVEAILDETDKDRRYRELDHLRKRGDDRKLRSAAGTADRVVAQLYRGLYSPRGFIHWPVVLEILGEIAADARGVAGEPGQPDGNAEAAAQAALVRDIFGNLVYPTAFSPDWRTDTAVAVARQVYESRDFGAMPILADALQEAGCDNTEILGHCRSPGPHARGCWVVDLVLGNE